MQKYIYILLAAITTIIGITSCSSEDDIDELFVGKKWYMHGATINGMNMNSDVKNFYESGDNGYFIIFNAQNTFQGALSAGNSFSGTWKADGKKRTLVLNFSQKPSNNLVFDTSLFGILKDISNYEGDSNVMQIKKDNQNYIRLNTNR